MSNTNLTSYNFHNSDIRVVQNDKGEVLFCLADVCTSLNLSTPAKTANQIKEEFQGGELNSYPLQTKGGVQQCTMITEPQLYFVMMRSNSKIAREFRQWICNEVLPEIRKNGEYSLKKDLESIKPYNCWFYSAACDFCKQYGLDEVAYMSLCNHIQNAYIQGYRIARHTFSNEVTDNGVVFTQDETNAVERVINYHQYFRPSLLEAYKQIKAIEAQAEKLLCALKEIPTGKIFDAATAADLSICLLRRKDALTHLKLHKNKLVTRN